MKSFKTTYIEEIKPKLQKKYGIKNAFSVPRIEKAVINIGLGEAVTNKKAIEHAQKQLEQIAGQKPVITKARKSIAAYKIRKGLPIGVKVTLRGKKMYYFIEKLIRVVLPRLRDFRGIKDSSVDQHGNLNIGFTEQTIFPEIEYDKIDKIRGLEVTIVTSSKNKEHGRELFSMLGIPFASDKQKI
ncbi:MAG: 50S ribosomal protein L5 [bacterium]|nr:50S ribosomal protein L5 [bacterium]